ncbi:hypothetical protein QUD65_11895 [Lacticaseibacillus paracasei]|jgi:hypothetical protein|uniref:hypothetical protein n=1 Tax=Lacticaseibacillus paracasei TaxID=1597 RepID=UPI000343C9DB|nr:hypothetical protein [Lacticaseibacillus paracasei]EPC99902.1 hypothetical protein Lpp125_11156 [Lacticaseibacillus paracasei subsp. paracasei Lpp125]MDM7550401.1 hypothetical protein [Lacticaseibacillus paracasei]
MNGPDTLSEAHFIGLIIVLIGVYFALFGNRHRWLHWLIDPDTPGNNLLWAAIFIIIGALMMMVRKMQ